MSERFKSRKSWREKLENPPAGLPKVVKVPLKCRKTMGGENILVPTPLLVDGLIHKVPKRKLITVGQIRRRLAEQFNADSTCPLTTGIFLWIISEAAEEDRRKGNNRVTPYWRVVKDDGSLNVRYPGGVEAQAANLETEGHKIIPAKGKKPPKVADFEKVLV